MNLKEIQLQSRHRDIETLLGYVNPLDSQVRESYLKAVPSASGLTPSTEIQKSPMPNISDEMRSRMLMDRFLAGELTGDAFRQAMLMLQGDEQVVRYPQGDMAYR